MNEEYITERSDDLLEDSKYTVLEVKKKLNTCVSKKEYDVLMKKIILNQDNIVFLIDISKDPSETMSIYSEDDLEEFFDNIQGDIDNSL